MNLFNEAIYKNHLEHTAAGTKWGKHKYLYITPSGRYVYPEDISKGKGAQEFRKQQINDQIRSAHQGSVGTGSNNTAKVSGTAAGSKKLPTSTVKNNTASRNTITIKKTETPTSTKTEEKKTETTTSKDGEKYKNMSEETKQWLMKNAGKTEDKEKKSSGKKGSGGSKKKGSSGKKSSSSSKSSTKTEEANKMGLSDDDLKKMEVNTDATNRDDVLKNIALRVIRGDYGNGADRKAKLGKYYDEVQKRVNELMKSGQIQRQGGSKSSSNTNSVAKQLSDMSGMKTSATQKLIKLYEDEGAGSDAFEKELNILSEGDAEQAKKMIAVINKSGIKSKKTTVKHSDILRDEGNFLEHIGKKHRSGRYAYGSGGRPYQHEPRNHSWRDRRTMPDEDLNAALNRARKELDLYNAERNNRSAGQKFVEDVLTSVGKSVLIGAGTGAIKYAGRQFVMKELENEDLANAMFGGGGKKKGKKDKK